MAPTTVAYDVMTQGPLFCDLTFVFDDLTCLPELGQEVLASQFAMTPGASFTVAAALSRMGLNIGVIGQLGTDVFSKFIADQMREVGLSLNLVSLVEDSLPTVSVGISFPNDRLFITYNAHNQSTLLHPRITVDDLERHKPRALFTHREFGLDVCKEARKRGILLFLDAFWGAEYLRSAHLRELLPHVDVFLPNLAEALEITGASNAEDALGILAEWCQCVVVKCGSGGAIAQRNSERATASAFPVEPIDTTGAGDNFNAGFIYGFLRGYSLEMSLWCANISGALSTRVLGGGSSPTTAADLERGLEHYMGPL